MVDIGNVDAFDVEGIESEDVGGDYDVDGEEPPPGFVTVTVEAMRGSRTVVLPRRNYYFDAEGNTFYIALDGDDANDGSLEHPWASFDHALPLLEPGDVLYVRGGDYFTPFTVEKSGEPGRPIVILSLIHI